MSGTQLRRRLLADLVLLVILWGYVAPAALGATEADLPACCRGNGKHHCAMASMANRGGGTAPVFRANSPQCPYRLLGSVLHRSAMGEARKLFSLVLSAKDFFPQIDSNFYVSGDQIRASGRSPPALFLELS
jgi:hypothetical protein